MSILLVVDNPKDWPLEISGVQIVPARSYLTDERFVFLKTAKVFNLCKSYAYQSLGYYVSLLAEARRHKPLPSISTIQDMKIASMIKIASQELEDIIKPTLQGAKTKTLTLSIYFGRCTNDKYEKLSLALFNQFPSPLLRAEFTRDDEGWELKGLRTIELDEIPADDEKFMVESAQQYFSKPTRRARRPEARYDLAILFDPEEKHAPSDEKAIKKFEKAAESMGFDVEQITSDDYGRIAEFDALFIRETTKVNHHTFRFSRRAQAEGLVVIDDPESILRCANKVYLAEMLHHNNIPHPETMVIHRGNWENAPGRLGLPFVLKQPDSSFSLGVKKVKTVAEYEQQLDDFFGGSDLLVAQAYVPTEYDWRIGVLERQPLYACRYFMADNHWQIYNHSKTGDDALGNFDSWPVDAVPPEILKAALKAANHIGDGLYGVDVKEVNGKPMIVEINDNPSLDTGVEDQILGDELYLRIMRSFLRRLESRGR